MWSNALKINSEQHNDCFHRFFSIRDHKISLNFSDFASRAAVLSWLLLKILWSSQLCIFISPVWLRCCCSVAKSCPTLTTPWAAAHQASLSFTTSQSLLRLMSIGWVRSSNHLILCCPLLLLPSIFPSIRVLSNHLALPIRWPKYWSFSFSISPSNEYSRYFPLGLTGLISLLSKGLSRVFSSTTIQNYQLYSANPSLWTNLTSIHDYWKNHSFD